MKGRRAVAIAGELAAQVEACLLRAGCVSPPRADLAAALLPDAVRVAGLRKARAAAARRYREAAAADEAACAEAVAGLLAVQLRECLAVPPAIPWDLDPVSWAEAAIREAAA